MSMSAVTYVSERAAQKRYDELVGRIPNLERFMEQGLNYELDVDEMAVYDELRRLEFLLGNE